MSILYPKHFFKGPKLHYHFVVGLLEVKGTFLRLSAFIKPLQLQFPRPFYFTKFWEIYFHLHNMCSTWLAVPFCRCRILTVFLRLSATSSAACGTTFPSSRQSPCALPYFCISWHHFFTLCPWLCYSSMAFLTFVSCGRLGKPFDAVLACSSRLKQQILLS